MPRIWGVSVCTTVCCILRMPSARTVAPWSFGCPLALFVWVILSLRANGHPLPEHLLERAAAHRRHVRGAAQTLQPVDGRLHHVVRIARAEALGEHVHHARFPNISSSVRPRIAATSEGRRRRFSPSTVAFTMLCGLRVPRHLVSTFITPATSSTARTPAPAITPVPGDAGLSSTSPAPNLPTIMWGIDPPFVTGTWNIFFFADSPALRMASATSFAFPRPTPTRPCWSPSATIALNENRRPPFTTLAQRFTWITRS